MGDMSGFPQLDAHGGYFTLVALKLLAAHFVAWGLIQRRDWSSGATSFARELAGAGLYAAVAALLVILGSKPSLAEAAWLVITTAAARLVLDVLTAKCLKRSWLILVALQVGETLLLCGLAALALDSSTFGNAVSAYLDSQASYGIVVTYAVSLWLGGTLVRLVVSLLPKKTEAERIGLDGAGNIIGILERLLVTSFVVFWPAYGGAAIGLIFSAKSIARFPEMGKQGSQFAEYYLVGTLTSFAVAIGAGMIARIYLL